MEIFDIKLLKIFYLYSNTPFYLYKHFRKILANYNISNDFSLEEIQSELNKYLSKKERNINDIVLTYALLISLSFFNDAASVEFPNVADLSSLEWGNPIRNYISHTAKPINVDRNKVPPVNVSSRLVSINKSNSKIIESRIPAKSIIDRSTSSNTPSETINIK